MELTRAEHRNESCNNDSSILALQDVYNWLVISHQSRGRKAAIKRIKEAIRFLRQDTQWREWKLASAKFTKWNPENSLDESDAIHCKEELEKRDEAARINFP